MIAGDEAMRVCELCGRALTVTWDSITDDAPAIQAAINARAGEPVVCSDCEAEIEQLAKLANTAHALAARLDVAGEHGASDVAWDIKTALEQIVARRQASEPGSSSSVGGR